MIKERTLKKTITLISKGFPVLLLTGPRQVGKTTLLKSLCNRQRAYVTLDDGDQRYLARKEPELFLQKHPPPLLIDEVQYAPELFSYIKIYVDEHKKPGMFWLTGSQKFQLMNNISESLAGRVAIINMLGFSQGEKENRALQIKPFMPTLRWIKHARKNIKRTKNLMTVYKEIWQGSYPGYITGKNISHDIFYSSYLQTYIQRDVKDILNIKNNNTFLRFLRAIAARTGQLLNYADISRDADIDYKTAKSWLSVLEASGLIYLLQPYHNNASKRLLKTPKIYFLDTGLCSYITQWPSHRSLEAGAMSGAMLESYVVAEILKSYWHNGKTPYMYYYRDTDQKEIDLVIETGDTLYPVEIKKTATFTKFSAKRFSVLSRLGKKVGHGAVLCLKSKDIPLGHEIDAIPICYL